MNMEVRKPGKQNIAGGDSTGFPRGQFYGESGEIGRFGIPENSQAVLAIFRISRDNYPTTQRYYIITTHIRGNYEFPAITIHVRGFGDKSYFA